MYLAFAGLSAIALYFVVDGGRRVFMPALARFRRIVGNFGLAIFLVVASVCTILAQKNTTDSMTGCCSVRQEGGFGGESDFLSESSFSSPVENNDLTVTHFCYDGAVADIAVAWTFRTNLPPYIDVYANYSLTNDTWAFVGSMTISRLHPEVTNSSWSVTWPIAFSNLLFEGLFPTNASIGTAFFVPLWFVDTDGDWLCDGDEMLIYHTDYSLCDTDGDGLPDGEEVFDYGTSPINSDTDGDGIDDYWDLEYYDALDASWPSEMDLQNDDDCDGISNYDEYLLGSNPYSDYTDEDSLPDYWEYLYGLNLLVWDGEDGDTGDPDRDGWCNLEEFWYGTDPRNPDTDFDGIIDSEDSRPLVPDDIAIGQGEAWVRLNYPNEASDILSMGYGNWVDHKVGTGLSNGYFKFTANFTEAPNANTLLTVGSFHVVVQSGGEYSFLLEKGAPYQFGTYPYTSNVVYTAVDDLSPTPMLLSGESNHQGDGVWTVDGGELILSSPSAITWGFCQWLPIIRGTPNASYIGPYSHITFSVDVHDCRIANAFSYHWIGENADLVIDNPHSRSTGITFTTIPSWRLGNLRAEVEIGTNRLVSVLNGFAYGENQTPQVHIGLSVPAGILLNANDSKPSKLMPITLDFSSDIQREGIVRLSCVQGSDHIALWQTRQKAIIAPSALESDATDYSRISCYVEGVSVSEEVEDITFRAEFLPEEGDPVFKELKTTVVKVNDIVLPAAPSNGLVVLKGTPIAMRVDSEPIGSGDLLTTLWYFRQLQVDGCFTDWNLVAGSINGAEYTYLARNKGIFQIQAIARVATGSADTRYYLWSDDEPKHCGFRSRGDMKAFGVCDESWQISLRNLAKQHLGGTEYSFESEIPANSVFSGVGQNKWKCNAFVSRMIISSGLSLNPRYTTLRGDYPPSANDWSTGGSIAFWRHMDLVDCPQPGLVIGHPNPNGMGHCGIVDFDGAVISAGTLNVNRSWTIWYDGTCGYNQYINEE